MHILMNSDVTFFSGQRLCASDDKHIPGSGVYERKGYIYSSVAGLVNPVEKEKVSLKTLEYSKTRKSSLQPFTKSCFPRINSQLILLFQAYVIGILTNKGQHTVPTPGDIVTAQVPMF